VLMYSSVHSRFAARNGPIGRDVSPSTRHCVVFVILAVGALVLLVS
jgi:hypothetical protein